MHTGSRKDNGRIKNQRNQNIKQEAHHTIIAD